MKLFHNLFSSGEEMTRGLAEREGTLDAREKAVGERENEIQARLARIANEEQTRAVHLQETLDGIRNAFRQSLGNLQNQLGEDYQARLSSIGEGFAASLNTTGDRQADAFRSALEAVANNFAQQLAVVLQQERGQLEQERARLAEWEKQLGQHDGQTAAEQAEVQRKLADLQEQQRILEKREQSLASERVRLAEQQRSCDEEWQRRREICERTISARQERIEEEVDDLLAKRHGQLQEQCRAYEEEIRRLRNALAQANDRANGLQGLQDILDANGWRAEDLPNQIEQLQRERDEGQRAYDSAAESLHNEIFKLKQKLEVSREQRNQALEDAANAHSIQNQLNIVKSDRDAMKIKCDGALETVASVREELKRLQARPDTNRNERIHVISDPDNPVIERPPHAEEGGAIKSETEWLAGIEGNCDKYGIKFPRRLLQSFHTALKSAELSPLTVLAGVSGTGKSLLPKLYAHFGGLLFHSVAVQPNWDGKESLLGYFNSIDNRFKPESILKFLAQASEVPSGTNPNGFRDAVGIVLLDEMNLAHPELYFADFLSKLEDRRECADGNEPKLDVDIGTGCAPYELPLGRNILWTGTMNQDETTKSLSDKVIDRSMMLFFPRPKELVDLRNDRKLDDTNRGNLLPYDIWREWTKPIVVDSKLMTEYKTHLEAINQLLAKQGRAIGHRVWQAVELYMGLHPEVRRLAGNPEKEDEFKKALRDAFEDQLVLKVMPKLRGLETSGESLKGCLDPLRRKLDEMKCNALGNDFENAMQLGDGQFMWMSADYLNT